MCKLCNTDRPEWPIHRTRAVNLEMLEIIKEYIGEYPCKECKEQLAILRNQRPNANFDEYVMRKLYKHYVLRYQTNFDFRLKKSQSNSNRVRVLKSYCGIKPVYRKTANHTIYEARIKEKGKTKHIGSYSTFKEALEAKIKYCDEYGMSRALLLIKNKLKELSNGNN